MIEEYDSFLSDSFCKDYVYDELSDFPVDEIVAWFIRDEEHNFSYSYDFSSNLMSSQQNNSPAVSDISFFDDFRAINYKIISNFDKRFDNTKLFLIRIDDKTYRAMEEVFEEEDGFWDKNITKMPKAEMIDSVIQKHSINFDWIFDCIKKHKDLVKHRKDVVDAGGGGYTTVSSDEIRELLNNLDKKVNDFINNVLNPIVSESFFNYSESVIEDLSIVDGVSRYYWSDDDFSNDLSFLKFTKENLMNWTFTQSVKYPENSVERNQWKEVFAIIGKSSPNVLEEYISELESGLWSE